MDISSNILKSQLMGYDSYKLEDLKRLSQKYEKNGNKNHVYTAKELAEKSKKLDELNKVCKDFESLFLNMLFKEMRKTVDKSHSLMYGGQTEEIFSDMLYEEYSKTSANRQSFGISKMMYDQLKDKV